MTEEKEGPVHYQVSVTGRQAAGLTLEFRRLKRERCDLREQLEIAFVNLHGSPLLQKADGHQEARLAASAAVRESWVPMAAHPRSRKREGRSPRPHPTSRRTPDPEVRLRTDRTLRRRNPTMKCSKRPTNRSPLFSR